MPLGEKRRRSYPGCMEAFVVSLAIVVASLVGLRLHARRAGRLVDDGPTADPAEAAAMSGLASDPARIRSTY